MNYPPISDRISRDRFYDIHRYLHFADNSQLPPRGEPGYDRLGKVREIMDKVLQRFLALYQPLYQPHCENAIDEAMIPCVSTIHDPARASMSQSSSKNTYIKASISIGWVRHFLALMSYLDMALGRSCLCTGDTPSSKCLPPSRSYEKVR